MNNILIGIIVLILVSAWWFFSESRLRKKAVKEIATSNGTFDEPAQRALESLEKIQCPTPRDNFLAARIIDLNAHEGRINNIRVLNNVVDRYYTNLKPSQPRRLERNARLHRENNHEPDNLDWFEIDQIENFAARHMDIMMHNPQYNDFIEAVLEKRPKKVIKTLAEAKSSASNKKEAFDTYVDSNISYTSDSQNVHDSAVNEHLRTTYTKLRETTPPTLNQSDVMFEVPQAITDRFRFADTEEEKVKKKKILSALSEIEKNKFNTTIGTTEQDLLTLIWSRSNMPCNFSNKEIIRDAVLDSLIDMSTEKDSVVCSNGRCARLMESLVCTDADQSTVNGAMTVQQIRNDAFQKSNEILQDTLEKYKNYTTDENLRKVAMSYEDPSIVTNLDDELRFKKVVKEKIEKFIDTTYVHRLSTRDYGNLKTHCLTAIDSI